MSNCCADATCPECVERRRHQPRDPNADPLRDCKACERCNGCVTCRYCMCPPAPRKRFYALGHRMPLEMGLLALGKNRDARAGLVAITARRIGHINDLQLRLHLVAIFVYGKANDVVLDLVGLEAERERRMRARAAA